MIWSIGHLYCFYASYYNLFWITCSYCSYTIHYSLESPLKTPSYWSRGLRYRLNMWFRYCNKDENRYQAKSRREYFLKKSRSTQNESSAKTHVSGRGCVSLFSRNQYDKPSQILQQKSLIKPWNIYYSFFLCHLIQGAANLKPSEENAIVVFEVIGGSSELFSVVRDAPGNILCLIKKDQRKTHFLEKTLLTVHMFSFTSFLYL